MFSPVLSSRYRRAYLTQEKSMHGAGYRCPGTRASGRGLCCNSSSTPVLRLFSQENHDVKGFGILNGLPQGVYGSLSAVWVPGHNVTLVDDFLDSGAMGDSSESYLLRGFSQAMVCKHTMDKMGETGKTGGKLVLWQFQPLLHLLAYPRDAAECRLQGSHVRSPSASGLFLPFWSSLSCLQLLCCHA